MIWIIEFCIICTFLTVTSGLVNVDLPPLGFAGGRVVMPSSGGFSRSLMILGTGRNAVDTWNTVAICCKISAFYLHQLDTSDFPGICKNRACVPHYSGPFRGLGSGSGPGGFFFWTRYHNLVVFDIENCAGANCIARQRYIRGNSFATENTWVTQMTVTAFAGEALLSLYRNSYTVTTCLHGIYIAILRYNVCISMW